MNDFENKTQLERSHMVVGAEENFLSFTRFWFELIQGEKFLVNWHHRWIAETIDNIIFNRVKNKNLIVNIPPGGTKTELLSIHLPAYTTMLIKTGKLQKFRSLNISFSDTLIRRNSRRTRDIIDSREFRAAYPGLQFGVNQSEEWELIDPDGRSIAQTISRSMQGQITGSRAGYYGASYSGHINLDDPQKVADCFYQTKRENDQRILLNTIRSRRGDKSEENPTPIFLIQQRLHIDDISGFLIKGGLGIEFGQKLVIPAILSNDYIDSLDAHTRDRCWADVKDSPIRDFNGIKYRSYWQANESIDQLLRLADESPETFHAQYMQQPIKSGGNLLDIAWFGRYEQLPLLRWRTVFVDTNSGKITDTNDYTVFMLVGYGYDDNLYIIDSVRGKYTPDELLDIATELWAKWSSHHDKRTSMNLRTMNIEDKQAGSGLIETLKKHRKVPVNAIPRGTNQNKVIRHYDCYPQIKMGRVFIPQTSREDGTSVYHVKYHNNTIAATTQFVTPLLYELEALSLDILLDRAQGYDDQYDCLLDAVAHCLIKSPSNIANWV